MKRVFLCGVLALVFSLVSAAVAAEPLHLFAGAGLKKPLDVIIAEYTKATGVKVLPNYGSSGSLYSQIESGQPCDLFLSADWKFIEKLAKANKLVAENKFLSDHIVLIVSPGGMKKVSTFADLTKPDVTITVADKRAPVGTYSENGLVSLGLMEKVRPNIKAMPTTVNQVAIMVKEDQVDAGLTFSSVATMYGLKAMDTMTAEQTGEIVFGFGVLNTPNAAAAKAFVDFARKRASEFAQYGWTLHR